MGVDPIEVIQERVNLLEAANAALQKRLDAIEAWFQTRGHTLPQKQDGE
jgi:hypothetical protein